MEDNMSKNNISDEIIIETSARIANKVGLDNLSLKNPLIFLLLHNKCYQHLLIKAMAQPYLQGRRMRRLRRCRPQPPAYGDGNGHKGRHLYRAR